MRLILGGWLKPYIVNVFIHKTSDFIISGVFDPLTHFAVPNNQNPIVHEHLN